MFMLFHSFFCTFTYFRFISCEKGQHIKEGCNGDNDPTDDTDKEDFGVLYQIYALFIQYPDYVKGV